MVVFGVFPKDKAIREMSHSATTPTQLAKDNQHDNYSNSPKSRNPEIPTASRFVNKLPLNLLHSRKISARELEDTFIRFYYYRIGITIKRVNFDLLNEPRSSSLCRFPKYFEVT